MIKEHDLPDLLLRLASLPEETEWVEFKANKRDPNEVGQNISALANSATLKGQPCGYIVWGVEDETHRLVGTSYNPKTDKKGNEELENWLCQLLFPKPNIQFYNFDHAGLNFSMIEIPAAYHAPIAFYNVRYVRVGSCTKKLHENTEKEGEIWRIIDARKAFKHSLAMSSVSSADVLQLLDWQSYTSLVRDGSPLAASQILTLFERERFISPNGRDHFDITNLGAILLARDFTEFEGLQRKGPRVIVYSDQDRVATVKEHPGKRGYAAGFSGLMAFVNGLLPENELIGQAFRAAVKMYPEIALRELVANAIIHQDLTAPGQGPRIEIFTDRIEIINPGCPLIDTSRFLDAEPISRNDEVVAFMHRAKICEERGGGIDKVFDQIEFYQLPAPDFIVDHGCTKSILFAHRNLAAMDRKDRVRACYWHAVLHYVATRHMTNTTLRKRLGLKDEAYGTASKIIRETLDAGLIKPLDPDSKSNRYAKYVPYWA
jgi:ATP-dependent DNA helicase RecG